MVVAAVRGAAVVTLLALVARDPRSWSAQRFHEAQVSPLAEQVRAEDLPFDMPLKAPSRFVGTDYVRTLAKVLGCTFHADTADLGIVAALDELTGPGLPHRRCRLAGPGVL